MSADADLVRGWCESLPRHDDNAIRFDNRHSSWIFGARRYEVVIPVLAFGRYPFAPVTRLDVRSMEIVNLPRLRMPLFAWRLFGHFWRRRGKMIASTGAPDSRWVFCTRNGRRQMPSLPVVPKLLCQALPRGWEGVPHSYPMLSIWDYESPSGALLPIWRSLISYLGAISGYDPPPRVKHERPYAVLDQRDPSLTPESVLYDRR